MDSRGVEVQVVSETAPMVKCKIINSRLLYSDWIVGTSLPKSEILTCLPDPRWFFLEISGHPSCGPYSGS